MEPYFIFIFFEVADRLGPFDGAEESFDDIGAEGNESIGVIHFIIRDAVLVEESLVGEFNRVMGEEFDFIQAFDSVYFAESNDYRVEKAAGGLGGEEDIFFSF